jgi:hypothetical protein
MKTEEFEEQYVRDLVRRLNEILEEDPDAYFEVEAEDVGYYNEWFIGKAYVRYKEKENEDV